MPANSADPSLVTGKAGDPSAPIAVDVRRLPWVRRLIVDYAYDFAGVAPFYSGNPTDRAAWTAAIVRTQAHGRPRAEVTSALAAQQERRNAPLAAREAAARLADPKTVAVVTGQQAGLFGGPLFTLLKALTALKLAEHIASSHQVPAVAVFWIDSEDHDWDEVRACTVFDASTTPQRVALPPRTSSDPIPVSATRIDRSIDTVLQELEHILPATEFRGPLIDDLRGIYKPGVGMGEAFGRWLELVLGARGLVVYDAADPATKPLVSNVFARELSSGGETGRLAAATGSDLVARGYHSQVQPGDALAVFHLDEGRRPIRAENGEFIIGDRRLGPEELVRQTSDRPASFSPNVLLRPIIQDSLFPTVSYVAGPSELAYLGQLQRVYGHFGVPMPIMYPRASATLLDSAAWRFLQKYNLPLEALHPQDDSALNALVATQIPRVVDQSLAAAAEAIDARMARVIEVLPALDPTLEGAARSTLSRMQHDLETLKGKIIQAAKRRDETLRRQFVHTRAMAFPGGHPQEREIGFLSFLNQYGPALITRLSEQLPLDLGRHWVLTI